MAQGNGHNTAGSDSGMTDTDERVAQRTAPREFYDEGAYAQGRPYEGPYPAGRYPQERPVGDLLQDMGQDLSKLVNLEVALAKVELSEKAGLAGKGIGFMGAGGFVIYAGFLAIVFAAIAGLANLLPLWLSALIVGVIVGLIGYALVKMGQDNLKPEKLTPQRTIDSLKADKQSIQNQVR